MSTKKKWSEEEIQFIKDNFKTMKYEEIGNKLGRTRKAVMHVGASLNLNREAEVGDKFNRLTIISKHIVYKHNQNMTMAVCNCDCGKQHECKLTAIVSGYTKSCGCLKSEKASARLKVSNFKHGKADLKNNRIFRIWSAIKTRCFNQKIKEWKNYGGRGITICEEWKKDYEIFEKWALENGYSDELTIDRINVNGNYEPSNCRWVGKDLQARNRRNNRQDTVKITAFGETKTVLDWLNDPRCNLKTTTSIIYRIGAGWTPEDAISKPSERK